MTTVIIVASGRNLTILRHLPLTSRAKMRRAAADNLPFNMSTALEAWFPFATVYVVRFFVESRPARTIDIIPDRRTPAVNRRFQYLNYCLVKSSDAFSAKTGRNSSRMYPRQEQRLISVDIPQTGNDALV